MIIWRGWGILVFIAVFSCSLAANVVANSVGGKGYWETHGWPLACALLVAAAIIWPASVLLGKEAGRVVVDERTRQRLVLRRAHDFFFIRLKWWTVILASLALLILVTQWAPGPSRSHAAH